MEYGYIRVSTREQNEQRLPDSWKSATVPFCGAIFFSKERPFLSELCHGAAFLALPI